MKNIKQDLSECSPVEVGPNISKGERKALRQFMQGKGLVIFKADKGDVVVVLSTSTYLELAYEHLNDRETYKLLKKDSTQEIV